MALFARMRRLVAGWLGLAVSGLEERNPEALLDAAKQEFRDRMAVYNQALARLAGVSERLKLQLKNKTTRSEELERRILANIQAENVELAGTLARELQELKTDMGHDFQELQETEAAYQANLQHAKIARKEFEEKVARLERQLNQVKIKEAQAEAAGALSGVAFKVGDMGDTMKRVQEALEKRYETAAGKERVAMDLADRQALHEKENERKALDKLALEEFLTSRSLGQIEAGRKLEIPLGGQAARVPVERPALPDRTA